MVKKKKIKKIKGTKILTQRDAASKYPFYTVRVGEGEEEKRGKGGERKKKKKYTKGVVRRNSPYS